MHTVIIADKPFAIRERALLARLEVGLADEGVRVVHALPAEHAAASTTEAVGIQSTVVGFQELGLPFSLRGRAAELLGTIDALTEATLPINVVHAFGGGAWPVAIELAHQARAAVLLEVWRPGLIASAAAAAQASRSSGFAPPEFMVSEPPVGEAIVGRFGGAKVHSAPWGVHGPAQPRPAYTGDRPLSVAMLCDTGDPRAARPALEGLVRATSGGGEVLVFAGIEDETSRRETGLWSLARKLDIVDRFSIAPDMEARREPILQVDLLLLPEAGGRQRTLVLEAMAAGTVVIAAADPYLESLSEGITAHLVRTPSADAWATAIGSAIDGGRAGASLVQSAHQYVRSQRSASRHVAEVLRAYQAASASAGAPAAR